MAASGTLYGTVEAKVAPAGRAQGPSHSIVAAVLYVAAVAIFTEYRGVFEFDPDESNNLIKALLIDKGFALGRDIWTDQPPFFTSLLRWSLRCVGWSVANARNVVLCFSGLVLFALFDVSRRWGGLLHGMAALLLLATSTAYVPLSVSVMIGLPSIALLALSIWAWSQTLGNGASSKRTSCAWSATSGALLGLSLTTKLFTAFMAPVLVLAVIGQWLVRARRREPACWWEGTAFSASLLLALALGGLPLLENRTWSGLIETHAEMRAARSGAFDGFGTVKTFLREDWLLYLLAALGSGISVYRRRHGLHLWTCWLVLAVLSLADHFPVWPHHRLLMSVPAALLAGHAIGEALESARPAIGGRLKSRPARFACNAGLVSLALLPGLVPLWMTPSRIDDILAPRAWSKSQADWAIYKTFHSYAHEAEMVATSRPIHAFRAQRPLPPDLAVTSWKRFKQKQLTPRSVVRQVRRYPPQVLLLSSRWPANVRRQVVDVVRKTHCRVQRWPHQSTELWVENGLAGRVWAEGKAKRVPRCSVAQ